MPRLWHRLRGRSADRSRKPVSAVEQRLLLEALDTVLRGDRDATYVSTPITTGERFVRWRRSLDPSVSESDPVYRAGLAEVVQANVDHARPIVERVAETLAGHVIDPTRLGSVNGWTQYDFHAFWTEVISRYASTVVFVDGWQFSTGCVLEFSAAVRAGRRILDERLKPLPASEALSLVRAASEEIRANGLPTATMDEAVRVLRTTAGQTATGVMPA
jgi:hypothetical protein